MLHHKNVHTVSTLIENIFLNIYSLEISKQSLHQNLDLVESQFANQSLNQTLKRIHGTQNQYKMIKKVSLLGNLSRKQNQTIQKAYLQEGLH